MRIVRNERRIERLSKLSQYVVLAGLVIMLVTLGITWFRPEWFFTALALLPVGFICTSVGGYLTDRFAGPLAHHEAVAETLKGLDDRYVLCQYTLPVSHVLVDPGGLTAIVVKTSGGKVDYEAERERWTHRQPWKFFRQLAGQGTVGSPDVEAEIQVEKLEMWLADVFSDCDVPVRGVILFVNPELELEAADSPVPAFYRKKIRGWLRGPGQRDRLPADVRRSLLAAVGVSDDSR